jgi:hypothetical protein
MQLIRDPQRSLISATAAEVVSDSGELRRNWEQGFFTINTPRTQAAMGWIGGRQFAFPAVEIAITTRNAVVAVQSLDGNPISQAHSIMICLGARAVPSGERALPYYSEPIEGSLRIRAPAGLALYAWDARNARMRRLAAPFTAGHYKLILERSLRSRWLMLASRPQGAVAGAPASDP